MMERQQLMAVRDPSNLAENMRPTGVRYAMAAREVPADQFARFESGHVEFLGDDAAIMHVYVSATDASGEPKDVGHAMIALYVFARAADGWEAVARQDTLVRR